MTMAGDEMMRAFIGLDFDENVKERIYAFQQKLKGDALKGRWKSIDNFHLTLKFLTEIGMAQKAEIDNAMQKIGALRIPFYLSVRGLGMFAGKDSIRVLWLGLMSDVEKLRSLQREIDQQLAPVGFLPEKRTFQPHITIGQDVIFDGGFDQIQNRIGTVDFGMMKIKRFYLFKSEQIQNKRVYSKVSEYDFVIK